MDIESFPVEVDEVTGTEVVELGPIETYERPPGRDARWGADFCTYFDE